MNKNALTLSILMAVMGWFFINSYVSSREEEYRKRYGNDVLVVTAKTDIKEMDMIDASMLETKTLPKNFLQPGAATVSGTDAKGKEATENLMGLVGRIAMVPIKKGEQITISKVTEPGMRTGVATQITPGRRAFAIPVNEISGVGKLVKPGDRVDVIAVIDSGAGKEGKVSKVILQDVAVLAAGKSIANNAARSVEPDPFGGKERVRSLAEDTSFTSVTLEVDPQQAQTLALMLTNGEAAMTLSLRNNDDTDRVNFPATNLFDILGPDAAKVPHVQAPGGVRR